LAKVELRPEPPADLRCDDTHFVFWDTDDHGEQQSDQMGDLRGGPQSQITAARIILGDHPARLDGVGDQALINDTLFDHHLCFPEGFVHIAPSDSPHEGGVIGNFIMELGCSRLNRLLGVHHHRQRLVVDLDQIQGIPGEVAFLGHHHRHRIAGIAHFSHSQGRMRGDFHIG
jgi:hypothetical protein